MVHVRMNRTAWWVTLAAAVCCVAAAPRTETARVCVVDLKAFVDGQYALRLVLYHRGGPFYHGYALVPGRDTLPHRIDPTPAGAFGLFGPDGKEIDYPANDGVYAYKSKEDQQVAKAYREGRIKARQYDVPPPLAWDGKALAGTVDVWVMAPEQSNHYTPANWAGQGDGAFGGPAIGDGKVYLYLRYPDFALLARSPKVRSHILSVRGAPPGIVAREFGALMDLVLCIDARTGKTLWKQAFPLPGQKNPPSGKSGKGMTPCLHKGRLYACGHRGITCFDAETGRLIWNRLGRPGDRKDRSYGIGGGWSRDLSPVVIGGVLVFQSISPYNTLIGLDPDAGDELWRLAKVTGANAVPVKVALDGREFIIASHGAQVGDKTPLEDERMVLIDPKAGRIVWQTKDVGENMNALTIWGDTVCCNVVKGIATIGEDGRKKGPQRVGAFRVTLTGPRKLWQSDAHYPPHRVTPIAHRGRFYIDSRITGFSRLAAATGKLLGRTRHIYEITRGDHNWTWCVATNGRIITSGVLMFAAGPDGLKLMPGCLPLPVVSGYMCPVKPAVADGRLVVRTLDKLVCYDLRMTDELKRTKAAIERIEKLPPARAVAALAELSQGRSAVAQRKALVSLGRYGPKAHAAVDAVVRRLGDDDVHVRQAAVKTLAAVGKAAVGPLTHAEVSRRTKDAKLREMIAKALRSIRSR